MMRTEPCSRGEMNKMAVKMTQIEAEPRESRLCPKVPRGLAHGVGQKKPLRLYAEAERLFIWIFLVGFLLSEMPVSELKR